MKRIINKSILILTLMLLAAGCSDAPFNPGNEKQPPGNAAAFGLVEITISGIGTEQMTAKAEPATPRTAYSFSEPGGGNGDGTIQMEPVSTGSYTYGVRGSGGVRYVFATFKVRNAQSDGTAYSTSLHNLTFLAVDTDQTYGQTAVSSFQLFNGTTLTGPQAQAIANATVPTGRVSLISNSSFNVTKPDVLQIFTETEINTIGSKPVSVKDIFSYGFVTHTAINTPSGRKLSGLPPVNQFDGEVTFAFKLPLETQANQDPFKITMVFMPVGDSQARITQSLEAQTRQGAERISQLLENEYKFLFPTMLTLLPGATATVALPFQRLCGPVRIAGPETAPTTVLFPPPPVFQQFTPLAYNGAAHHIPATSSFSVSYDAPLNTPNAFNFVVHGSRSGQQFIGDTYSGGSTQTVTTPAGSFFPGEVVEVTATPGLGGCGAQIANYRVAVTNASNSGTFSPLASPGSFLNGPESVISGDWDKDGDLDLASFGEQSDYIILGKNDGSGSFFFTGSLMSVGDGPNSITSGDWNRDGFPDMAVTNNKSNNVSILLGDNNDNNDSFGPLVATVGVGNEPKSITSGDLDGDGDLDLAVANFSSDNITMLKNDGTGKFLNVYTSNVAMDGPYSIITMDWEGDGDLDLVVAESLSDTIVLLENDGSAEFSALPKFTNGVGDYPKSIVAGDWDADGDFDLAIANAISNDVSVLENDGSGFIPFPMSPIAAGTNPFSIVSGDWDADGDLDLAVANRQSDNVSVLENSGAGTFSVVTVGVDDNPVSVTSGDWDSDGDLDLAVANSIDKTILLLENN